MDLILEQLTPTGCMTYLIASKATKEAWLVDPVLADAQRLLEHVKWHGLKLTKVIDTHVHADHLSACTKLAEATGAAYVMHEAARAEGVGERVKDGQTLKLGMHEIQVIHAPGHTDDSICLIVENHILTGDALFLDDGGVGRDDLPGGNSGDHWQTLEKLKALPDNLIVHPGHDYRDRKPSPIAEQRARNPFLQLKSKDEYVRYLEKLKLGPAEWMKDVLKANIQGAKDAGCVSIPANFCACEVQAGPTPLSESEDGYIACQTLEKRINGGERPFLLDVREEAELTGPLGHLPGIVHIPLGSLPERFKELAGKEGIEIVSICKMGGRAKRAADFLAGQGFNRVVVMTGGMTKWRELGLTIKDPVTSVQK